MLSELHCENREMLERLFAGCPVNIKVEAMIALDSTEVEYNRLVRTVTQTAVLPALPQSEPPERLLEIEEARIQEEARVFFEEFRRANRTIPNTQP